MEDVKERLTQLVKIEIYNNAESDILAQVWHFSIYYRYTSFIHSDT